MTMESKSKAYVAEIRADIKTMKQRIDNMEMNTLKTITGLTQRQKNKLTHNT